MRPHLIIGRILVVSAVALTVLPAPESSAQELPPEMQVDRLLVQAAREIEGGEHWSAVFTFERILAVCEEHGLEIPTEFWFRQAGVLQGAGLHERAIEASTRYLQEAGRDGEHYRAALKILDAAEVGLAEARRAEARLLAILEREAREAAARRATILPSIPEMVVVPAGTFQMGCVTGRQCRSGERPVHEVRVESFELSKYEVTFAQWDVCVEHGGCRRVEDLGWGRDNRPVIHVSWDDAQGYVAWLSKEIGEGYRLPSEAEWEYAARAGTKTVYSWGDERGRRLANCDGCRCAHCGDKTSPVGSFPPNPFGLHDMHGNVREWVRDCWNDSYDGAPTDGRAWERGNCSARVARGGSWATEPNISRAATRWSRYPHRDYGDWGFRIARTPGRPDE